MISGDAYFISHAEYVYANSDRPHPSSAVQNVQTLQSGFSLHARQHASGDGTRNKPPVRSFEPSYSAFSSSAHDRTSPSTGASPRGNPVQNARASEIVVSEKSRPSSYEKERMTLFGPPTRKQPGHSTTSSRSKRNSTPRSLTSILHPTRSSPEGMDEIGRTICNPSHAT